MSDITLVTGGTGTLGSLVVQKLRAAGVATRVLSRHAGPDIAVGDLASGVGVDAALAGVSTVIHCATGKNDEKQGANLIAAARRAGVSHLVYISIVGVDRHPFAYYRAKYAVERLVEDSGLPFTILRATQFHNLVVGHPERAAAVAVHSGSGCPDPAGRGERGRGASGRAVAVPSRRAGCRTSAARRFGGCATSRRCGARPPAVVASLLPLVLPGKTFRAFSAGLHLAPEHADGTVTFEQFLADVRAGRRSARPSASSRTLPAADTETGH